MGSCAATQCPPRGHWTQSMTVGRNMDRVHLIRWTEMPALMVPSAGYDGNRKMHPSIPPGSLTETQRIQMCLQHKAVYNASGIGRGFLQNLSRASLVLCPMGTFRVCLRPPRLWESI